MIDKSIIAIEKDIRIADTMPSDFYKKISYYNLSIKNIFQYSWQFIAKKSEINGLVYPFYFLEDSINEPLMLTMKNNNYRVLSNVCTHRASILCKKQNNIETVKCTYHGRSFNLQGELLNAPGFEKTKNFPEKKDNLKSYPFKKWKDFLFCTLKESIDIDSILSDIDNRLKGYPFNQLTLDKKSSNIYSLDAHWALYCENYLEGFHVPYIHKGLNKEIYHASYKTKLFKNSVLQYAYSNRPSDSIAIPKKYKDYNKNIYAYYYWLFPNLMLNFYSWGLSINIIEPIGKNKTKIRFLSYPIDNNKQFQNLDSSISQIEKEDQEIVLKVQKGIKSMFYNNGRYSVKHEKGIHHFHRLLCAYLN